MNLWIDNIILGLKETYNANEIYSLYGCLKIQIIKLDPNNILLRGNESFYHRDFLNQEVVFIKNDLHENYEKFILAHELGHAILHTNTYEAAFNRNLINFDKLEKQSNYFALKLLNIEFDTEELEGLTIEQISNYTGIPYKVLSQLYI